jgi:hypothetical protein
MLRIVGLIATTAALTSQVAYSDEVRRTKFAGAMVGTWAPNAESCQANDKSNIVIAEAKYTDTGGDCTVQWIVETPGAHGPNYAVHASCVDASKKTNVRNIVIRPQSNDQISIGTTFDDLKTYQRCASRQ